METEDTLLKRLAEVDDQLVAAQAMREQIHAKISDLTRQHRYISWLLDVLHIRQNIRQLTLERDMLEEHLAQSLADGEAGSNLDDTLYDIRERMVAAEDMLASLLANPPGNDGESGAAGIS